MYQYGKCCMPYMPYTQMMNMPDYCYPMVAIPQQELEGMYPKTYSVIMPVIERNCDMMDMKYGMMYSPTREEIEAMADNIVKDVSPDVDMVISQAQREEERQLGLGGRRILRDLALILLIRELIRRRNSYGGGYGGYYGYPGGMFGGYPVY
mgnify:CR=1 FL=1